MSKETYIHVKRDMHTRTTTDTHMCVCTHQSTYLSENACIDCVDVKRDLHRCQKRPAYTYYRLRRDHVDLLLQVTHVYASMPKETYVDVKRDLHICQKRPV